MTFTLLSIYLTTKQNILCWATGIVGVTAYFFIFLQNKLYAEMSLQVVFFIQSIYGWYNWRKGESNLPVSKLSYNQIMWLIIGIVATATAVILILKDTDSNMTLLDTFAAVGGLFANYLLTRKVLESWLVWILVDVLMISLFLSNGLYLSSALYFVFLLMAIRGLYNWKRDIITV